MPILSLGIIAAAITASQDVSNCWAVKGSINTSSTSFITAPVIPSIAKDLTIESLSASTPGPLNSAIPTLGVSAVAIGAAISEVKKSIKIKSNNF